MVELLLASEADAWQLPPEGKTALHLAATRFPGQSLRRCSRAGRSQRTEQRGLTPLHVAARKRLKAVAALLEKGAGVDGPPAAREDSLSYAAERGHADVVALLCFKAGMNGTRGSRRSSRTISCGKNTNTIGILLVSNQAFEMTGTPLCTSPRDRNVQKVAMAVLAQKPNLEAENRNHDQPLDVTMKDSTRFEAFQMS